MNRDSWYGLHMTLGLAAELFESERDGIRDKGGGGGNARIAVEKIKMEMMEGANMVGNNKREE